MLAEYSRPFQSRPSFLNSSYTNVHFGQDKLVVFQLEAVGGGKLACSLQQQVSRQT